MRRWVLVLSLLQALTPAGAAAIAQETDARAVTEGDSASRAPAWSPDGGRIAFESDRGGTWGLHVLEVATGTIERAVHSDANDRYPAWSPDGTRIAFVSDRGGEPDLHILDLRSREVVRVVRAGDELFPAWSPDGREIAFTRQHAGAFTIRSVGVERTAASPAIDAIGAGVWPRWSPDGRRLAFFSRRDTDGEDDEIYVADRGSGHLSVSRAGRATTSVRPGARTGRGSSW